jgi:hypothetical protein
MTTKLAHRSTTIAEPISMYKNYHIPSFESVRPVVLVPRNELPQEALAVEASTLGWDTVNAIRLPQVNRTLRIAD